MRGGLYGLPRQAAVKALARARDLLAKERKEDDRKAKAIWSKAFQKNTEDGAADVSGWAVCVHYLCAYLFAPSSLLLLSQ